MKIIAWWFLLGAVTWAVSVGVKIVLSGLVDIEVKERLSAKHNAALQGLLSAVTELGAAAFVFLFVLPEGKLAYVIAFGAGAGIIEAAILLIVALLTKKETESAKKLPWYQQWTFFIERFGAFLGHVGSRGLIWLGVHGPVYSIILAVIGFASVDGVAVYGTYQKWDWLQPKIWKRFYGFVMLVGVAEIAVFFSLYLLF
ncbi:MAG: hypothetical protein MJA84_13800 [Firmicutes bacterium]|nr:hypothetical protein [Bacillota bacterium]